jgi:membrane protein
MSKCSQRSIRVGEGSARPRCRGKRCALALRLSPDLAERACDFNRILDSLAQHRKPCRGVTPFQFVRRVLRDFRKNQGLLLAGAVAYYALLSLVPLFTLLLVALSHFIDRERLLATVATNLEFLVPGHANAITEQVSSFLEHREVVGVLGLAALLFFSAMAFSVLESAMAMIFHHREKTKHRHAIVSAIIPYLFVLALGIGLLLVTLISGALEAVGRGSIEAFGRAWSLAALSRTLLHLMGTVGSVLVLTALYAVMPVGRVAIHRSALGALAATLLWEIVRHALVWYFANLSMVNVVYGSLATTVIVLLTLEVAALILLLGAQVIAELERAAAQRATQESR